ncbi:MAG: hypothetical protein KIT84_40045 [Labilithrix sp.]|nr:hypothetical protein [Labilithrix sp.]
MRRFAVPSAVLLGALATLLACSGAEQQDVLSSQIGSSASGSGGSTTSTSGSSGATSSTSTSTSGTSGDPPGRCAADEQEDNDTPLTANEFTSSICGHLGEFDNDDRDYLTFTIPLTATRTSFGFEGNVRVYLSGPGAIDREYRPDRDEIQLLPGRWQVRLEMRGGGNNGRRVEWRVFYSYS